LHRIEFHSQQFNTKGYAIIIVILFCHVLTL
jgi:hypothetical protein